MRPTRREARVAGGTLRGGRGKTVLGALLAIAVAALLVDGIWIEPNHIEVTHWQVPAPVRAPLKLAHLSDLHVHTVGRREHEVIEILRQERPDAILVTGDSVGFGLHYDRVWQMLHALAQLQPPLGVWVVRGNWEVWHPIRHEQTFYASAGVHFLLNSAAPLRDSVWVVGLDDPWSGRPRLEQALAGVPAGAYTILLFHSPFFFRFAANRCSLALSGHTHGGQVRLPLVPLLWLPGGTGRYLAGWYFEQGSRMYVSRGVGWSHLPIRLNCPPEIAIITLTPGLSAGRTRSENPETSGNSVVTDDH